MSRNERVMEQHDYIKTLVAQRSYSRQMSKSDEDDLFQECITRCLEADERYDAAHGKSYQAYMHEVANYYCIEYFNRRMNTVVPMSEWGGRKWAEARKARAELANKLLREPSNREVSEAMGITLEQYEEMRAGYDYSQVSMSELEEGMNDEACLGEDFVGAEESISGDVAVPGPEQQVVQDQATRMLREQIDMLLPNEAMAIKLSFGVDNTEPLTQEAVAAELGVSQPTVHRLLDTGIRKLRGRLTLKGIEFEDFLTNAMRETA